MTSGGYAVSGWFSVPTKSKTSDGAETRAESFRVPVDCAVDVRPGPEGEWRRMFATNISMSGMFVRTPEAHPRGTDLEVKFELQNGQPAIRARAEVLWRRERDAGPELPRGLGVRFIDLDLNSKYAISSLVDRYQQLGRVPFHLMAAEEEDSAPVSRSVSSRRGALALAFLAGAASGALATGWWIGGAGGGSEQLGRVARGSELTGKGATRAAPAPVEERAAEAAGGAPATRSPAPPAAPEVDREAAVATAIADWARAWQDRDVERYLDCYARDFQPASGMSLEAWRDQRRDRLGRPGVLEVRVSELEIELLAADRALARFVQDYSAPGYRDRVEKQLELVRRAREWTIRREEVLAQLPAVSL